MYKELRALPHVSIRFKLQRILYPNISPRFYCCASNACTGSVGKKRWKVAPEGPRTDEDELRARGEAAGGAPRPPRPLPGQGWHPAAAAGIAPFGAAPGCTFFLTSGNSPGRVWLNKQPKLISPEIKFCFSSYLFIYLLAFLLTYLLYLFTYLLTYLFIFSQLDAS